VNSSTTAKTISAFFRLKPRPGQPD
jgi:hypothetical protein